MEVTYVVPELSCSHCEATVTEAVYAVAGVTGARVDLASKHVAVRGERFDDAAARAAIEEAGYDVA